MNFRRLHTALIAVACVVYLFSAKGYLEISDTGYSVETAVSLYDHGSLKIATEGDGSFRAPDGNLYSRYGVGFPISLLPYVAAGSILSHVVKLPRMDLIQFFISFANIPFAIATLSLFSRLLRKWAVAEKTICFLTVALALGTLFWRYAAYDYSEELQMALLMVAVQGVIRPQGAEILWAGISCALLVILKLIFVLVLPVFCIYLLVQFQGAARIKALVQFGLPLFLAFVFIGWVNHLRFGSPWESGYGREAHSFNLAQIGMTIPQLLGSLQHGMFVYSPVLILGLVGWPAFLKRHWAEALFCLGLILVNLLWTAAWLGHDGHGWDGGWAWGPRLLVPLIPLWLLPAAFFIEARGHQRWFPVFLVIAVFSVFCQIPEVLIKDQEIHHIRSNILSADEAQGMPADSVMAWILLFHKLAHTEEVYRMSDLTRITDAPQKVVDLTSFRTFQGMNVWTEQISRQFHQVAIRWLPLFGLVITVGLVIGGMSGRRNQTNDLDGQGHQR